MNSSGEKRMEAARKPRYDQRLVRPSTRGELRDRLKAGETCEVAAHVAEMTAIVLTGWLQFDQFNVDPSENKGWVLFVPNVESTHGTNDEKQHES